MKKLRGMRLVMLGVLLYAVYLGITSLLENVPDWVFRISAIAFGGCIVVGFGQVWLKKDDELDDDMRRSVREKDNRK